jgi:hypothetical protein
MQKEIEAYNQTLEKHDGEIAKHLTRIISQCLTEATCKIWHRHPVWFINENPIVGYSKQKRGMRLMFWSGCDFDEDKLNVRGVKFKDASIFYQDSSEILEEDLVRWLKKAHEIQWDYKNIIKRKGRLERI